MRQQDDGVPSLGDAAPSRTGTPMKTAFSPTCRSLGQHFGVDVFRAVQPVTATFIPPLAWVAFRVTAVRSLPSGRNALHLTGPPVTLICAVYAPGALDLAIVSLYVGYGVALLLTVVSDADGMPRTRLETGDVPGRIWCVIGVALLVSAFIDAAIAVTHLAGVPQWIRA